MNLLIIGATGLVGTRLITLVEKSDILINNIYFVASEKSVGKQINFRNNTYNIKSFNDINLSNIDIACIVTNSNVSIKYTPILQENNIIIIDNSSAYRTIHPLTIPDINFKKNQKIYINPNCCVIPSIIALYPIHTSNKITNITYNTYQSCSGGGYELLRNLENNNIRYCIPYIGLENDFSNCDEEEKLIYETKKILNSDINIIANTVRVPVDYGHLINIQFTTLNKSNISEITSLLSRNTIYNNKYNNINIKNDFNVYTYRLKQLNDNTFSFYCYSNNLLRGSSYNSFLTLKKIID